MLQLQIAGWGIHVVDRHGGAVLRTLARSWAPALVASSRPDLVYTISEEQVVLYQGRALTTSRDVRRLALKLEGHLLSELGTRHETGPILHAAGIVFGEVLWLFLGAAGSGKSTFTREAIRQGAWYLSDDTLFWSKESVKGLGRTIQFDPLPRRELPELPMYWRDCDVSSYWFAALDGDDEWVCPLWVGDYHALPELRVTGREVIVVDVTRGAPEAIEELSELERVRLLLSASLVNASSDVTCVPKGRTFRCTWQTEPARLLTFLRERAISTSP